ncbi:MAG: hypothetical protein LKF01_07065 [Lactobacillus sp.]|jgi:AcrR family transcriptional regulator|nr:hypothetical protein [Lactobacillus sp.]MCH3906368.1 hypothetical protein [Lactobacillus sp.]MCH3990058.1 hypothetical protein [Lactobacillus sp.]MCH4069228.1 hypothetical protein [Lactobacillus sp.]MCI1303530.1 hypothetical protein [Lactobacillus sp.]
MKNPYVLDIDAESKYTMAQESLRYGLIDLLNEKSIEQVSVKELCQKSSVARSTFYAYYNNVKDLLVETEDWFIAQLSKLDQNITDPANFKNPQDFGYFYTLLHFIEGKKELLTALVIKNYDHELVEKWKLAIKSNLFKRIQPQKFDLTADLLFEMLASEVISAFIFYLQHLNEKDSLPPEQILQIIANKLADFKAYF